MLQKSKSARAAKFKFLILIPLIFAMLTYVSCSDTTNLTDGENENMEVPTPPASPAPPQALSQEDAELVNQLESELQQMEKNGKSFLEISEAFMIERDKHIQSKEAYYRFHVFMNWIKKHSKERDIENGDYNEKEFKELWHGLFKPYEDYVAYRKSQPVKENTSTEGVPFTAIETVPTYPGCENLDNAAAKKCMSEQITNFINQNFDTNAVKPYAEKGTNRIYVRFVISKEGTVENIQARASSPELVEEGKRVVALLPKMKPGENDGKPVDVLYSLPIIFQVGE
ncbi:energy transducer TonB [Mesonia mobilis]|nr:energy transducer TonB [Mesonia mobilis]